jgi:hypothetical protein
MLWGSGGASPPPAPTSSEAGSRALRGSQWVMAITDVSIGSLIHGLLGREELLPPRTPGERGEQKVREPVRLPVRSPVRVSHVA